MSEATGARADGAAPSMRTPLGRVRGLGAAGEGAGHWWHERLTSIAALLLFVWLGVSLLRLPALDYGTITEWLRQPLAAAPMLLLIVTTFWHGKLGLQVVVEDYVHEEGGKFAWIVLINFAAMFGAALALFALLKIALGGAPA
jgi:succinate dehydrogenase / fumarate reductase membrane anchor subunit